MVSAVAIVRSMRGEAVVYGRDKWGRSMRCSISQRAVEDGTFSLLHEDDYKEIKRLCDSAR